MSWSMYDDATGLPNLDQASLIPIALLKKAFIPMIRVWDSKWKAELEIVMPKMKGHPNGASHFEWPLIVDPQAVSEMHNPYGRTRYWTTGMEAEQWNTRLTKAGFAMDPEEMLNEFTPEANFGTSQKMQKLTQICIRSIERRVELELVNYLFGNVDAIKQFSNQWMSPGFDRLLKVDCKTADKGMLGYSWDDPEHSNPFKDIDNIIELQSGMGDKDLNHLFIGTKTAKILKNHDVILNRIKYARDVSGGTLQAFFGGLDNNMAVHVVKAQTFKAHATQVNAYGGPGTGDLTPDNWTTRNKYWFMRESSYEFAFMTASNLGFTFTSRTCPSHNGEGYYTKTSTSDEPEVTRVRFELKFSPGLEGWGDHAVIRRTVPQTA